MRIARSAYDHIRAHALGDAPREACGVVGLSGASRMLMRSYRATNVSADPCHAYEVDPEEQMELLGEIERDGLELGAVYHTHPVSLSAPSLRDMVRPYPGVLHIIVGMGRGFTMQAWELGHTAKPVVLEVV